MSEPWNLNFLGATEAKDLKKEAVKIVCVGGGQTGID